MEDRPQVIGISVMSCHPRLQWRRDVVQESQVGILNTFRLNTQKLCYTSWMDTCNLQALGCLL